MTASLPAPQVLNNFLSNAVKFTEVGGIEVDVRVLDAADGAQAIEIAVSDTGIGITKDQQRRLFEEFAQAESTTSKRFGDTGFGLVMAKRLAVLMGGDVTLESVAGKGTTLTLALGDPADVEAMTITSVGGAPSSRPLPTREEARREGSLLLLVEDHPVNRTVLVSQLETIGFHADTAPDGQDGFEAWRSGDYALVLTDLNMPRMDGFELAREIRSHERDADAGRVPILALTASVMQGEPERCRAAGLDDFAAKPTTIPFLEQAAPVVSRCRVGASREVVAHRAAAAAGRILRRRPNRPVRAGGDDRGRRRARRRGARRVITTTRADLD